MSRIIEGKGKGGRIPRAKLETRPILARVKKSLFSSIEDRLKSAYFLDLYAGSGSCGIEALSRGVDNCVFVEKDKGQAARIRETLNELKMDNAKVISANVFWVIRREKTLFDIIFLGPPYQDHLVNKTISAIDKKGILRDFGLIIAQHHKKEEVEERIGSCILERQKSFGETILSFYLKK